jgi:membrane protease YdiL (CAAX protease family)
VSLQGEPLESQPQSRRSSGAVVGLTRAALVVVVAGTIHALAFRPSLTGTMALWWWMLGGYALLTAVALHYLWQEGTFVDRLAPRWGDLSIGFVTAAVLLLASWLARGALAPSDTPRYAWLYRLYLQLGDPEVLQNSAALTLALLAIAVAEELVWRGMVLDILTVRFGSRSGWMLAALLYACATLPTLYALRDPVAGPNPLLPTAALGAGIVWSFVAARLGRLPPVMISHMVFSYFSVVQFRWPGM